MKKEYQKPAMRVVLRHHQARLLVGSDSSVRAERTSYGLANGNGVEETWE